MVKICYFEWNFPVHCLIARNLCGQSCGDPDKDDGRGLGLYNKVSEHQGIMVLGH